MASRISVQHCRIQALRIHNEMIETGGSCLITFLLAWIIFSTTRQQSPDRFCTIQAQEETLLQQCTMILMKRAILQEQLFEMKLNMKTKKTSKEIFLSEKTSVKRINHLPSISNGSKVLMMKAQITGNV